jgi:hypothetical protein
LYLTLDSRTCISQLTRSGTCALVSCSSTKAAPSCRVSSLMMATTASKTGVASRVSTGSLSIVVLEEQQSLMPIPADQQLSAWFDSIGQPAAHRALRRRTAAALSLQMPLNFERQAA